MLKPAGQFGALCMVLSLTHCGGNGSSKNSSGRSTFTLPTCELGGIEYAVGDEFRVSKAEGDCWDCICGKGGQGSCVASPCRKCDLNDEEADHGEAIPSGDGCNTCLCDDGSVTCTTDLCADCRDLSESSCEAETTCQWLTPGCHSDYNILLEPGCYSVGPCQRDSNCRVDEECHWVSFDPCPFSSSPITCTDCGKVRNVCFAGDIPNCGELTCRTDELCVRKKTVVLEYWEESSTYRCEPKQDF